MEKHFVTFFSPGTMVAETTTKGIASWNVEEAKRMAGEIKERRGAKPYGFQFTTRGRGKNDLDSKVVDRSLFYYLGGVVLTIEEIKARNSPKDSTLISNMECNGWDRIIQNDNSWRWVQPLEDGDVVLDMGGAQ